MTVKFLGQPVSLKVQNEISTELDQWKNKGLKSPHLTVILVGKNPASQVYVGHKAKMCKQLGFGSDVIELDEKISETDIMAQIQKLNLDTNVDAILVQLPLPAGVNERKVLDTISADKDADCLTTANIGKLVAGLGVVKPCTPSGVMEIFKYYDVSLTGKKVAVIGRSLIVGTPLALMLQKADATVTVFHSRSGDFKNELKNFDIVCVAIGKPEFFKHTDFKQNTIVIDVGIHRKADGKLCGDVESLNSENKIDWLKAHTPVPGGVGPMTIAMLMKNTLNLAKARR